MKHTQSKKGTKKRDNLLLTPYEREIEEGLGESMVSDPKASHLKEMLEVAAREKKLISIRINEAELAFFRKKTKAEYGIPYQTAIQLLINKFNRGAITI